MNNFDEMVAIKDYYADKKTARSGVELMNHINEGVKIMERYGASHAAKMAFCLHPLLQNDSDLITAGVKYAKTAKNAYPVLLAMEYRSCANAFLADKVIINAAGTTVIGAPSSGPLEEVRHMLIADKIQNRKDFELYHKATHDRSGELTLYFYIWLEYLGVSEAEYQEIVSTL